MKKVYIEFTSLKELDFAIEYLKNRGYYTVAYRRDYHKTISKNICGASNGSIVPLFNVIGYRNITKEVFKNLPTIF